MTPNDTKEKAQIQLIELLLDRADFEASSKVLDVGCGIGGTSRFLAKNYGCRVTGVTISGRQVEIAKKLTLEASKDGQVPADGVMKLGDGSAHFIELDAEKMGQYFTKEEKMETFDCVWISEAMSHLPNKQLFFENAAKLLNQGGKLMVADWFKNVGLSEAEFEADISPIEGCTAICRDGAPLTGDRRNASATTLHPNRLC